MTLAAIDVRDLVGQPGMLPTTRVEGTVDELGTELARVRRGRAVEGDLPLGGPWSRASWSRAPCAARWRCSVPGA